MAENVADDEHVREFSKLPRPSDLSHGTEYARLYQAASGMVERIAEIAVKDEETRKEKAEKERVTALLAAKIAELERKETELEAAHAARHGIMGHLQSACGILHGITLKTGPESQVLMNGLKDRVSRMVGLHMPAPGYDDANRKHVAGPIYLGLSTALMMAQQHDQARQNLEDERARMLGSTVTPRMVPPRPRKEVQSAGEGVKRPRGPRQPRADPGSAESVQAMMTGSMFSDLTFPDDEQEENNGGNNDGDGSHGRRRKTKKARDDCEEEYQRFKTGMSERDAERQAAAYRRMHGT